MHEFEAAFFFSGNDGNVYEMHSVAMSQFPALLNYAVDLIGLEFEIRC